MIQVVRLAVVALLLGSASLTAYATEHRESAKEAVFSEAMPGPVYLAPAWLARALSLGHPTLAADYYWMGALQYFGRPLNVLVAYKDLHRYIDRVNALDPDFHYAYHFGGVSVPWNLGHWQLEERPREQRHPRAGPRALPRRLVPVDAARVQPGHPGHRLPGGRRRLPTRRGGGGLPAVAPRAGDPAPGDHRRGGRRRDLCPDACWPTPGTRGSGRACSTASCSSGPRRTSTGSRQPSIGTSSATARLRRR